MGYVLSRYVAHLNKGFRIQANCLRKPRFNWRKVIMGLYMRMQRIKSGDMEYWNKMVSLKLPIFKRITSLF